MHDFRTRQLQQLRRRVLVATFSFRVHADASSIQTVATRQQTRMAARAGVDVVRALLAANQMNMDAWYNNP